MYGLFKVSENNNLVLLSKICPILYMCSYTELHYTVKNKLGQQNCVSWTTQAEVLATTPQQQ